MTKPKTLPIRRDPALRRAFHHLDQSLQEKAPADYSERIDLFGRAHFGDLWNHRPKPSSHKN